jgi:hypothetical protein
MEYAKLCMSMCLGDARTSAIAGGSSRLRAMADRSGQRAWHREPGTMPGYGVAVGLGERAGGEQRPQCGEQCPQCGESDLGPYGNGSKWACPRCYFIVPCCEGGERAARPSAKPEAGSADGGPGAAVREVGRSRPGLPPRAADVTSLVVRCRSWPAKLRCHSTRARTSAHSDGREPDL